MIADRHIFIIGQQRIVGPELATDIGGVVLTGVEVDIVADNEGHLHLDVGEGDQVLLDRRALVAVTDVNLASAEAVAAEIGARVREAMVSAGLLN